MVVKISGLLDPIVADYLRSSLDAAASQNATAVVLRIDSPGSVISDERIIDLARRIRSSQVPVYAWVGPAGSRVEGATAQLLATVRSVGLAPGSAMGRMGRLVVPRKLWSQEFLRSESLLRDRMVGPAEASKAGLAVTPRKALVIRNMLLEVPGFHATTKGSVTATPVQFSELSTFRTAMHTFASPAVAVLFLVIGLCLVLLEFYTAGIGVAGLTGAACVLFASYGLGVLPVRPLAVAAVVVAMVAFAVDVQVGVPRLWTVIGSVLTTAGLVTMFDGVATPWPAVVGSAAGVIVFMVFGMPALTRSRFSTPVIDRRWLVGRTGSVVEALNPAGVIEVDGGLWAGTGDRPVEAGRLVRIVGVDGVVCLVEPDVTA